MRKRRANREERVMGIAWYRPEQWPRLREVSADIEGLEETHAEWLGRPTRHWLF